MKDHTLTQSFLSNDRSALGSKKLNSQHFDSQRKSHRRSVVIVIELVTLEKLVGNFMGSHQIGKVIE